MLNDSANFNTLFKEGISNMLQKISYSSNCLHSWKLVYVYVCVLCFIALF